jgi:hypothetical protein
LANADFQRSDPAVSHERFDSFSIELQTLGEIVNRDELRMGGRS